MTLSPGARLGPYEIVSPLGAGGMGEVYRARDTRLDRDVAIKVLPAHLTGDPTGLARFEREAKAIAALSHPNILALHDIGREGPTVYLVMELLDGQTLRERLASGALPTRKAIEYGAEIADGLAAAHERGIVHRDLKPENVFITRNDRVKLLDFGLARATSGGAAPSITSVAGADQDREAVTFTAVSGTGVVVGTVGYMAPEQIRAQSVDHRTDIFAFGATLYEMVTGSRAFRGATPADTMAAILERDVPPLTRTDSSPLPPALERIVLRCLEKTPAARFQSATDLAFALRALSTTSQTTGVPSLPIASEVGRRRAWPAVALGFLGGLAAATAILLFLLLPRAPASRGVVRFTIDVPPSRRLGTLAISPDGGLLAYVATEDGVRRLFVRPFDQASDTALADTAGADSPFFSPDGAWVAFFAGNRLNRIPAAGGRVLAICEMPAPPMQAGSPTRAELGASGTWAQDGTIVFSAGGTGLWRVAVSGSAPVPVSALAAGGGELGHGWPDVLPDGRSVVFGIWTGMRFDAAPIGLLSLSGGSRNHRILIKNGMAPKYVQTGHLLYASAGSLLAVRFDPTRGQVTDAPVPMADSVGYSYRHPQFAVSRAGDLVYASAVPALAGSIVRVDRRGRVEPVVEMPRGVSGAMSLSPDGRRLVLYCMQGRKMFLWTADVSRGVATRIAVEGNPHAGIWAPDGQRLLFSSDRAGAANLFVEAADGSGDAERVLTSARHQDPGSWSRDGQWIVYAEVDPASGWDLWKLDMSTHQATLFRRTPGDEQQPTISPDGRWLAYASTESGRSEVYAEAFPSGGNRVQLSAGGGGEPLWSADGRDVFFRSGSALMGITVGGGSVLSAVKAVQILEDPFTKGSTFGPPAYAVAPDGQSFYFIRQTPDPPAPTRINVVLGWLDELRKR